MNTSAADVVDAESGVRSRQQGRLRRQSWPALLWPAVDALTVLAAAIVAELEFASFAPHGLEVVWTVLLALLALVYLAVSGTYSSRIRFQFLDEVRHLVTISAVALMTVIPLRVLLDDDERVAEQSLWQWSLMTAFLLAGRGGLVVAGAFTRRRGAFGRPTLIVGAGPVGRLTARRLLNQPRLGLLPVGFLEDPSSPETAPGQDGAGGANEVLDGLSIPVLGSCSDLEELFNRHYFEHVIITFIDTPHDVLLGLVRRCEELGLSVSLVPRLFEAMRARIWVDHLGGLPIISSYPVNPKGIRFAVKYAIDRVLAAFAIIVLMPVIVCAGAAIWICMGRPILFRQLRVGRDTRPFTLLKFRSMTMARPDAVADPASDGGEMKARCTKLGSILRRSSIDELPQLFNVLKGDMSLIGPRPERPEFVESFRAQGIYRYDERHRVKSGITGWAQVHGIGRGGDRFSTNSLSDRVEWDNYYIENWSLWLDVKIVLHTVLAVVRFRQA